MVGFHKVSKLVVLGSLLLAGTCVQAMDQVDPELVGKLARMRSRVEQPEGNSLTAPLQIGSSCSLSNQVDSELAKKLARRKLKSEPQLKENISPMVLKAVITCDPFKHCLSFIDREADKNLKQVNWNLYRCSKAQVTSFSFNWENMARRLYDYSAFMQFMHKVLPAYINLKHLRIDGSGISYDTLRKFAKLESLSATDEWRITSEDLAKLSYISSLSLKNMDAITNEGLSPLTNLKSLSLIHMENVSNEGLSPLTNLKSLSLAGMQKVNNEGFSHLTNLTDLTLSHMNNVTGSCLSHLSTLETLKLDKVGIEECTVYLCSSQLQKIEINRVGEFTGEFIKHLPLLTYLNCSGGILEAPAGEVLDQQQRDQIEQTISLYSWPY